MNSHLRFRAIMMGLVFWNIGIFIGRWSGKEEIKQECVLRGAAHYDTVTKEFIWDLEKKAVPAEKGKQWTK